jgi:hypothetical protein
MPVPGASLHGASQDDAVAAIQALDDALREAGIDARALTDHQRGFSVEVAGWGLDVGIHVEDGLLRAQAPVCGPGQVDPHELLHDHRKRPFVRFSHCAAGSVWVEGELPLVAAADRRLVDAMLGGLLAAAELARERARSAPVSE